ncbi:hypothetical protein GRI97_08290 [Altererythrobacter xixiisoli]|uniref:Uncharacterized protein n=1 Tax=Croceibacterium xixiisoli TaxID=1476466 RepID=A0A6I4TSR4_9SPHN|nr:hypothetical protein [Croceibacterium xixiisoli]MXO98986.1 hypothetical protein [Croceibacterium xixiisoli]
MTEPVEHKCGNCGLFEPNVSDLQGQVCCADIALDLPDSWNNRTVMNAYQTRDCPIWRPVEAPSDFRAAFRAVMEASAMETLAHRFPANTCPNSRHAARIAATMLEEPLRGLLTSAGQDPEHMAESIDGTFQSLWQAREDARRAGQ